MAVTAVGSVSLLESYRTMLLIRRFEERLLELHGVEIQGSIHPCIGQEAIPTGTLSALDDSDLVVATYRGHGWAIACGVPLEQLFAEICGRAGGTNDGRAGSAYLTSLEHGFVGENSIVGAGLPIADGLAIAFQLRGENRVAVVDFGDGATNQGATHEAIVFAISRRLPVIFVCENNEWSEMTRIDAVVPVGLSARAAAYGIEASVVDGNDPQEVADGVALAAARARSGGGPSFLECSVGRIGAHYQADIEHYRPKEDKLAAEANDPLPRLRSRLAEGGTTEGDLLELETDVDDDLREAEAAALKLARPDGATARRHVYFDESPSGKATPLTESGETLTYARAVTAALARELGERPDVLTYGEDIAIPGGTFGITRGLQKRFGDQRVFDTPISEAAILGSAVGAAIAGMRPIVEIMFGDFALVALDQLVNQAANVSYISSGKVACPIVVRTQQAISPGSCAQHSQSLEGLLAHIPGLRLGLPASAQDAYAMTRAAIASNDPVILYESRALYQLEGPVAIDAPLEELGGARLVRAGDDLLLVTWGRMVEECRQAAETLADEGTQAAVLDLRWLNPLDTDLLFAEVRKAGRVLVVHEANLTGGFGGEIVARIVDSCFFELDAPPRRLALPDVRVPASAVLQAELVPTAASIADAARGVMGE